MGDHTHNGLEWIRHADGFWYGAEVLYGQHLFSPSRKVINTFGHLSEKDYFALKLRGEAVMQDKLLELWIATF